ncbi:MAG: hypothetical protein R3304_12290 [Longimicrobiales bacterium]|nr:hypothetical protein [Longimicrobiales bacterium]
MLGFIDAQPDGTPLRELELSTSADATRDEQRTAIAERVKLGLIPHVHDTPAADRLRVIFGDATARAPEAAGEDGGPQRADPEGDPWNFWVFRVSASGFLNGQATSSFSNLFARMSANRTTEAWKISLGGDFSRNLQSFEISGGDRVEEIRRDWGANALAVRSLGDRWALGVRADIGSSTFVNQDLRWSVKPGVEYNFFPYAESSRRSLTLQYLAGPHFFDYAGRTIFGELYEIRPRQTLVADLSLVEPWGRWSTSLSGHQYLHDTSKYSLTLSGSFDVRLFRGFSVRMSGNHSWIRDQLFISAERATDQQILLRQRQLGTSYRYFTSFGIEYRFGSIFNNVVNPRFGGGGGNDFIIFG